MANNLIQCSYYQGTSLHQDLYFLRHNVTTHNVFLKCLYQLILNTVRAQWIRYRARGPQIMRSNPSWPFFQSLLLRQTF